MSSSSILAGFDTVQKALAAQQFALSITQKNVANANDPSYTREVVSFDPANPEATVSGVSGVTVHTYRDRFIDYSICQEMQLMGEQNAAFEALQQIDAVIGANSGQGLQEAIAAFFNSFSSLASTPEDSVLRQQVLTSAERLAGEFQRLYNGVQRVQISEDRAVGDTIKEINAITVQIAELNEKIPSAHAAGSVDEFMLRDKRALLLEQLSGLVDISYYETESESITVTTKQGRLLLAGNQYYELSQGPMPDSPFLGIQLSGVDITADLESGKLGGILKMRDGAIAGYLDKLDDLAAAIIARVNEQHVLGSDLDGMPGGNFFTPFSPPEPGSNAGAVRTMSVAVENPGKIAAAHLDTGPGNNENARLIADIRNEILFASSGNTISQFYSDLIYRIGSDAMDAEEGRAIQNEIVNQLKNQRDALSGVNLDEEAVNMIKYQKAYQASARFAAVLDALSDEILQLLGV